MTDDEKRAAHSPRKYFELDTDFDVVARAPTHDWVNEDEQFVGFYPYPDQPFRGVRFAEPPRVRFNRERGRTAFRDAAPVTLDIWLISDRLKRSFEQIDREAFVFQKVVADYAGFSEPGPDYWFVYIMRVLDCVDEANSVIRYQDDLPGVKNYVALVDVEMRPEIVGAAHAFRLTYGGQLIVDDVIVAALKAEKIRGFEFKPIKK